MRQNDYDKVNAAKYRAVICTSVKCTIVYINCSTTKVFTAISIKILSTHDDFTASCCDQDPLSENNKERSKRVLNNLELKYSRTTSQGSHSKHTPPTTLAINFWNVYYVQLPILSILAKIHLVACDSGLPKGSAFLCSIYFTTQQRLHLSEEKLVYSIFSEDKIGVLHYFVIKKF